MSASTLHQLCIERVCIEFVSSMFALTLHQAWHREDKLDKLNKFTQQYVNKYTKQIHTHAYMLHTHMHANTYTHMLTCSHAHTSHTHTHLHTNAHTHTLTSGDTFITSCVTVRAMRLSIGARSMSCVSATSHNRGWAPNTADQ